MFINDNGDIKEIGVKAFDTLPVGAEIDYDGTEVPDGWEEIDNPNEYSTEETYTGKKWIDGKPIYRMVFNGNYDDSATLLSNVSSLISVSGTCDVGTGTERIIPYYEKYNDMTYAARLYINNNVVKVEAKNNTGSTTASLKITLEYTKTTD